MGGGYGTAFTHILIEDGDKLTGISEIRAKNNAGVYGAEDPNYRSETASISLFDVYHKGLPILMVKKTIETAGGIAEEMTYLKFNGETYVPMRIRTLTSNQ